tara:strand:- start:1816 stop:2979 length:1164 start_codon:yes stop_codon:yes gene_type:complete
MQYSKQITLRSITLGAIFLLIAGCATVPEEYKEAQLIDRFIEVTNLYNQTDEIPKMIGLSIARQKVVKLKGTQEEFLERSVELNFDAEIVLKEVKTSIRQSMTSDDLELILAWYESEIGRRMLIAEENLRQSSGKFIDNRVDRRRIQRIEELLDTKYASEDVVRRLHLATGFVYEALVILNPQISHQKDDFLYETEGAVVPVFQRKLLNNALHTFLPLDLKDLDQYSEFLETPAAVKMLTALNNGFERGMKKSTVLWHKYLQEQAIAAQGNKGPLAPEPIAVTSYPFFSLGESITISQKNDLRALESNAAELATYFEKYIEVHIYTRDGQWTRNIVLPENPLFEGRTFRLTVQSSWPVNVHYNGSAGVIAKGGHFHAKYVDGRWIQL